MAKGKIKPAGKIAIFAVIAIALFVGYVKFKDKIIPPSGDDEIASTGGDVSVAKQAKAVAKEMKSVPKDAIKIGVVTWGGYAGGQYFNRGFKPNAESQFRQQYGFDVYFKVLDDFDVSRQAFKSGDVDLLWVTIDAFPTESGGLSDYEPIFLFQADWSRGGDAIVVSELIDKPKDLKGKKVAVLQGSPSHSFLIYFLDANGMSDADIQIVKVKDAIMAADHFKAGKVDAAVVWSPDDAICVQEVSGAKILANTRDATHIIADGFLVKRKYLDNNKQKLTQLVEGWLKGAAEINSNSQAKDQAAGILAEGLSVSKDDAMAAINNVRLTTYGDNLNFFGLNPSYTKVNGKELYNRMKRIYQSKGLTSGSRTPTFSAVTDVSVLQAVNLTASGNHSGEGGARFVKAPPKVQQAEAFASKPISITFPTGRYILDKTAQVTIKNEFVPNARSFSNMYIRIEGNTDKTGSRGNNVILSRKRAKSVADFLASQGFDRNRFIVVGNGPDAPVCFDDSEDCLSQNRRTDFELVRQ